MKYFKARKATSMTYKFDLFYLVTEVYPNATNQEPKRKGANACAPRT